MIGVGVGQGRAAGGKVFQFISLSDIIQVKQRAHRQRCDTAYVCNKWVWTLGQKKDPIHRCIISLSSHPTVFGRLLGERVTKPVALQKCVRSQKRIYFYFNKHSLHRKMFQTYILNLNEVSNLINIIFYNIIGFS